MTDINQWPELVQKVELRKRDYSTGKYLNPPYYVTYVIIPLNEYQIGNLLGALKRTEPTGDWYYELISLITEAMEKLDLKEVRSNSGDIFAFKEVLKGNLKEIK